MTKKASTSTSTIDNAPWERLKYKLLRNGNIQYQIETKYALITCEYEPKNIQQLISVLVTDLFNKALAGKWSDTPPGFDFPQIKFKRNFNFASLSDEQMQEVLERYIRHAWELFYEYFHFRLYQTPALFITEVLTATVADLAHEGPLQPKIDVADLFDEFIRHLKHQIKNLWKAPPPGRKVKWTPQKKTALIEEYIITWNEVLSARNSYPKDSKGKVEHKKLKEWEEDILKQYPKIPKDKISLITSSKWRSVVFDIVVERLKIKRTYSYKILRLAGMLGHTEKIDH